MRASANNVADGTTSILDLEDQRVSLAAIAAALLDSDLVDDACARVIGAATSPIGVIVVPSAKGWALVDSHDRHAYINQLHVLLATRMVKSPDPTHWRVVWALPQNGQGETTDAVAQALLDPRRPYARMIDRQGDCVTLAVEIDPASPYFEGHFVQAAVLAGVVQVEWAMRFGRELFGVGDDFRGMEALKFQKVIRPGDAVKLVLEWNRERSTLTFDFSSQAGKHSSGRIVFGAAP